jgi:GrpB-like predicted nucleotidyltransferase (UPF0157 family)
LKKEETISLSTYDPAWPKLFHYEKHRIKKALGMDLCDIEHVGSTAVEGMIARPVIDIQAGMYSLRLTEPLYHKLESLDYTLAEEIENERLLFIKRTNLSINLHIVLYDGERWRNGLLWRDYLRSTPKIAQNFGSFKHGLVRNGVHDLQEYISQKLSFINNVITYSNQKKGWG